MYYYYSKNTLGKWISKESGWFAIGHVGLN